MPWLNDPEYSIWRRDVYVTVHRFDTSPSRVERIPAREYDQAFRPRGKKRRNPLDDYEWVGRYGPPGPLRRLYYWLRGWALVRRGRINRPIRRRRRKWRRKRVKIKRH